MLGTFVINESIEQFIETNTATYFVRKHDQRYREITVPTLKLKNIQKWINNNILATVKVSESAHGFVKERSILTNAKAHIHTRDSWLLRIDIQNFFPSICIEDVVEIFEKLGYSADVSRILSMLCTKIVRELKNEINNLLIDINLEINKRKTRVQKKDRKKVTGLYIEHNQIVLPNSFLKKLESDIYYCKKYGILGHLRYHNMLEIANFKGYLYGKVAFIKMINPELSECFKQELDNLDW